MKLFYAATSPFARKVLVLAKELSLDQRLELVPINPWTDDTLRAANPFSQVPTLVLEDGTGLHDSPVICDYLDELGGRRLIPASGPARVRALSLQALGDGVCVAAVRRIREVLRDEGDRHEDVIARQRQAMDAGLDALEAIDLGDGFGLGEIAVACACGYMDLRFPADEWRSARPRLAAWFQRVAQRPSMVQTAPP